MQPKPLNGVAEELGGELAGKWKETGVLNLVIEESSGNIEYYVPNPYREVDLLFREKGLHLTGSNKQFTKRFDFGISFEEIKLIKILPSLSLSKRPSISFVYVAVSAILFSLAGACYTTSKTLFLFAIAGSLFGFLLSAVYKKTYRVNVLLLLTGEGNDFIVFSLQKNKVDKYISLLQAAYKGAFADER